MNCTSNPNSIKPHFELKEFFVNYSPEEILDFFYNNEEIYENLFVLAQLMQSIRQMIDCPIIITSGYRDPEKNYSVGGVSNSQHCKGQACDFKPVSKSIDIRNLAEQISVLYDFDQIIVYKSFIHISYDREYNRHQLIYMYEKDINKRSYIPH